MREEDNFEKKERTGYNRHKKQNTDSHTHKSDAFSGGASVTKSKMAVENSFFKFIFKHFIHFLLHLNLQKRELNN
jgi:hypothetical protein